MTAMQEPTVFAESLRPYFQVLVFQYSGDLFKESEIPRFLEEEFPQGEKHQFSLRRIDLQNSRVLGYQVTHTYPPTWLKGELRHSFRNSEHDLVIIYRGAENYLFVHISCDSLAEALMKFFLTQGCVPISASSILNMVNNNQVLLRTLGMQNVFGPGGNAVQAKSYHGRKVQDSLTPTADGGFGFSYATGVVVDPVTGKAAPFGCSLSKYKIWLSWTEGLADFTGKCDSLIAVFQQAAATPGIGVLATPADPTTLSLTPILFSLDYYVHRKGLVMVQTGKNPPSATWTCMLSPTASDTVLLEVPGPAGVPETVTLKLTKDAAHHWQLSYADPKAQAWVCFVDDDLDPKYKRRTDLVQYLNTNGHYCLVFDSGVAYVHRLYWQDKRYAQPFTKAELLIDWSATDITKESKAAGRNDTIADAIEDHFKAHKIGINDDGAGEVADFVAISQSDTFTLVHSKYSEKPTAGLRVGDLQVVCSQAIKNMENFTATPMLKRVPIWAGQQFISAQLAQKDFEDALSGLIAKLPALDKELWIVQPGISKAKLDADPTNKIHILLNYVDAMCTAQGVRFRFICGK